MDEEKGVGMGREAEREKEREGWKGGLRGKEGVGDSLVEGKKPCLF